MLRVATATPATTSTTTTTPSRFYLIPSPLPAGSEGGMLYVCMYACMQVCMYLGKLGPKGLTACS